MTLQHHQSKLPQQGEILGAVALADAVCVLAKCYIQLPMEIVFNPPMISQDLCVVFGAHHFAADEIAYLGLRWLGADLAFAGTHANHTQTFPLGLLRKSDRVDQNREVPFLRTAMTTLLGRVL